MLPRFASAALVGLCTGCAMSPESVSPSYVSHLHYQPFACDQLAEESDRLRGALALAYAQQYDAQDADIVSVIALAVPVASAAGDNKTVEIARLKGEIGAVRTAANAKGCEVSAPVSERAPFAREPRGIFR